VRFLARDRGIRQFLDVGTGIPSANNTHEVAQQAAPQSRIVFMFVASLQYAGDDTEVARIVHQLMAPCAPGSFLVISHPANDIDPEQVAEFTRRFNEGGPDTMIRRDRAAVTRLFDGIRSAAARSSGWPTWPTPTGSPGARARPRRS
jgi:hypothetical protein